jgi:uncharacterized protein YjhX (UPF0386 family)
MGEESDKERVEERRGSQLRTRTVFVCETGVAHQHGQRKQVERTTTLSLPPDNSFDEHDVYWERPKLSYESDAYKYAWIPQARLGDFREGLRETMERSYYKHRSRVGVQTQGGKDVLPGRIVNTSERWFRDETWHCECGPGSTQLNPDEMIASSMRAQAEGSRMSKVHVNGGKKVGCPACFVVRYPNPSCFQSVIHGGASVDGFVRVAWKLVEHSAACNEVKSTRVSKGARMIIGDMIRSNPKHSDVEIKGMYKKAIRAALMHKHGYEYEVDDPDLFDRLVQKKEIHASRDYYIESWTVKNVRAKQDERSWKHAKDEMASIILAVGMRANKFVIKFKRLEFALTEFGTLDTLEKRPCAWCHKKFDTASDQLSHMRQCTEKYGKNTDDDWILKWSVGERWRESYRLKRDREHVDKLTSQWVKTECELVKLEVKVQQRDPEVCKLEGIVSPIKGKPSTASDTCTTNSESSALEVSDSDDDIDEDFVADDMLVADARERSGGRERSLIRSCLGNTLPPIARKLRTIEEQRVTTCLTPNDERLLYKEVASWREPGFKRSVTRLDIVNSNTGNKWLNDAFINFYMALWSQHAALRAKVTQRESASAFFAPTYFHETLSSKGYDGVKTWSQKKGEHGFQWLDARYIFVPVNRGGTHWVAAIIDTSERVVHILDSLNGAHAWAKEVCTRLISWVVKDSIEKKHAKRDLIGDQRSWMQRVEAVPYQTNNHDCGVFVLSFARDLLDKERVDTDGPTLACSFDSEDMPKTRRVLIWDILEHGLDETMRVRREPKLLRISQVLDIAQPDDTFYSAQRDASDIPHITLTSGKVERRLVVRHPFVLILMNDQQGRWLWRCGHKHGIQLDSTFNTVRSRFSVFTICVAHASGYLPCAWFITSDECTETIAYCLRTLVQRLADDRYEPMSDTWSPSVAMIDCSKSETNALRMVLPGTKVFWCQWHVLKAMRENVWSKLPRSATRQKVEDDLHTLVRWYHPDDNAKGNVEWWQKQREFDEFLRGPGLPDDKLNANWSEAFINYYNNQWRPNIEKWAKQFRSDVVYSIDTSGAVESFHSQWKNRLISSKGRISQRRLDWMMHFLERVLLPEYAEKATAHECRGPTTVQRNKTLVLAGTANMIPDGDIAIIDSGPRASVDEYESEIITRPVTANVTFKGATHHVQYLEKLDLCAMTTDHEPIICSCRMGQKGDLCAPKVAAMMKIQKYSAFKALGLNPAGETEDADDNEDEYADVTMGEHLDEPEMGSLNPESPQPRRMITTPNVSTVEQRKLADTRQLLECALASLRESKPVAKEWLDQMHAVSTEVSELVQRRDELAVMANMIDDSSHAASAPATGLPPRGNRSNIDAGKRNSLTRERSFSEMKNHPPKIRRNGSER